MKIFLVMLFHVSLTLCFGQSFKVITCTPGVTVGTTPVTAGMIIQQSTDVINLPKGGAVGLLTEDGWPAKMTRTTSVDKLQELVIKPTMPGAVMDGGPKFYTKAVEHRFNSAMIGDTLFMFWPSKHLRTYDTFVFYITDVFTDPLDTLFTDKNWLLVNVSEWRKKEWDFIYTVSGRKAGQASEVSLSPMKGVRFKQKKKDLAAMNARIANVGTHMKAVENDSDKLFYQCAIYEFNDLHYDQLFIVYKILSQKKIPGDPFLKHYFDRLRERYGLDELRFN